MVTLLGSTFHSKRKLYFCLVSVVGVGPSYANFLCKQLGLSLLIPIGEVSRTLLREIHRIVTYSQPIGPVLRRIVINNVRKKVEVKSYEGRRHLEGLPVRGQNTKSNARTSKMSRKVKSLLVT